MRSARYFYRRGTAIKVSNNINEAITHKEVRLIGEDGSQLGIMSARSALEIAEKAGLDLVEISPNAEPPVCKIMDFGKYRFETIKKQKEAKKNQKTVEMKEMWLSMTIDVGDLAVKAKQTASLFTKAKLKDIVEMCGDLDFQVRTGKIAYKRAVDNLILYVLTNKRSDV